MKTSERETEGGQPVRSSALVRPMKVDITEVTAVISAIIAGESEAHPAKAALLKNPYDFLVSRGLEIRENGYGTAADTGDFVFRFGVFGKCENCASARDALKVVLDIHKNVAQRPNR